MIPALAATRSARVPIDLLAAHRAGLDGHRPSTRPSSRAAPVDPAAALVIAADAAPRRLRRRSAGGRLPAGVQRPRLPAARRAACAACGGDALDGVLAREVIDPLGLHIGSARQLRRAAESHFDERVAPTEVVSWRGGAVRGAVHDENAWSIVQDAAAGHAGLFGDARSVLDLGLAVLDVLAGRRRPAGSTRPISSRSSAAVRAARSSPASIGGAGRPRSPDPASARGRSATSASPARACGSIRTRSWWASSSTNRVHPTRVGDAIRRARPAVYDALWDAMRSSA